MTSLIERVRLLRPAAPAAPPPEPIDSEAATRFLDLCERFAEARAGHIAATGTLEASARRLADAEARRESSGRVERDGLSVPIEGGRDWRWADGRGAAEAAAREVERARGELLAAESAEGLARAALDESQAALVGALADAGHADRFLAMQATLATSAVAAAEAGFRPAVNRMMEARRARRHPRTPAELEDVLADGPRPAEAERAVEEADAVQQAAGRRAREVVAMRERFERAVEAALASERGGRRR
jgi:hypothetical protein